jgi:Ras-related protein Rab-1A
MVENQKRKMDIIIIGDSQVGKTSMTKQYDKKTFNKEAISTIGVDYINKKFKPKADPEKEIQVKVWDTAGQDRFRNLTYQMYRQADGIIIVFDKTNRETFNGVR